MIASVCRVAELAMEFTACIFRRLLSGKTPRVGRLGLHGLSPKAQPPEELGKRLRRKKRARVASPQPESRSQSNSIEAQGSSTVSLH